MKKIIPFESIEEAIPTLDNGGRFYNLLTKADDGNISAPELGKVAGVYGDKQKMVLYFAMSISTLENESKEHIKSVLSQELKTAYEKYLPQMLIPSEAESKGVLSSNAIVTGIPRLVGSKSHLNGFIMVPISTGKTMSFAMIPIIDKYEVYEVRDEITANTFLIAHSRGADKFPERRIRIGGVLKELKIKRDERESRKKFLEAIYYSDM